MPNVKADLSVTVKKPTYIIDRQSQATTHTPGWNIRDYDLTDIYVDDLSKSVMLSPDYRPDLYAWGKDDYGLEPETRTNWIEAEDTFGMGGKCVGWAGGLTTPWLMYPNTNHLIPHSRGLRFDVLWHRPADATDIYLELYPRINLTKTTEIGGVTYYFSPIFFSITDNGQFLVYEYPFDSYSNFEEGSPNIVRQTYHHHIVENTKDLGSEWLTFWVQPITPESFIIKSDVLRDGGFFYQSVLGDRENISLSPEGITAIRSLSGGLSLCRTVPMQCAATGAIKSGVVEKKNSNTVYPEVKVFGWGNTGYLDNTVIPADGEIGGISYKIYALEGDDDDYTEIEVLPVDTQEFKRFKWEVTLTATAHVSPTLTDIVCQFDESETTDTSSSVDLSSDVEIISEQLSTDLGGYKATLKVRNLDGQYDFLGRRPFNEIDYDIYGQDRAVLYTLNPRFDWYKSPKKGVIEFEWDCGDGFELLKQTVVYDHPPYDGMEVSDALTKFMNRIGWPDSMLDIDATTDNKLGKKRGSGKFQFKPENGTMASDFIQTIHDFFAYTYTMRFDKDGKFQFKVPSTASSRTFYMSSSALADGYTVRNPQLELLMDEFYNELRLYGKDNRTRKLIEAVKVDTASQIDPNSPNYIGRRKICAVMTTFNRQDALNNTAIELWKKYNTVRRRLTFDTKLDPALREGDFFLIHGYSSLWKIVSMTTEASPATMSRQGNVHGCQIMAVEYPVSV